MKTYETETFRLTMGRHSGCGTPQERPEDYAPIHKIRALWRQLMEEGRRTGVYVSATVRTVNVVYANEHACPPDGEPIAVIEGTRNPFYCEDGGKWLVSLFNIVKALQRALGQVTCQLDIAPCRTFYFTQED